MASPSRLSPCTGASYQGLNSQAIQWSLAKYVFRSGTGLHYEIIPLGILVGIGVVCLHWLAKRYIKWVRDRGDLITTPLALFYLRNLVGGINSPLTSCIMLGICESLPSLAMACSADTARCLAHVVRSYAGIPACQEAPNFPRGTFVEAKMRSGDLQLTWLFASCCQYCYLLAGSVDGAAEIMVFILSFAVFGGSGTPHPFPTWFGNPEGPSDHCVTTRTY